jgi:hypothetical protein
MTYLFLSAGLGFRLVNDWLGLTRLMHPKQQALTHLLSDF